MKKSRITSSFGLACVLLALPLQLGAETIGDVVGMSLYKANGDLVGFRVRPKKDPELFEQLGFQPKDIITTVNSQPVEETQTALEIYRNFSASTSATFTVLRNGKTFMMGINLDEATEN